MLLGTALHYAVNAGATPANGFTATTLAKGTLGSFEVFNHFVPPIVSEESEEDDKKIWLSWQKTKGESDLYVQSNVWASGGSTGWHSHPGLSLIIVTAGTLTAYEGDDPTCTPHVYTAGMGFVDPGGSHVHIIRWMPTFLAAAGEPDIVNKLENGYTVGGKTWKIHPDGYNFLPYFKGEGQKGPREEIFYFGQGGELNAVRWNDWKVSFAVVNGNIAIGTRDVPGWPVISNLRADPFESASHESGMYIRWYGDNIWLFVPIQNKLKTFLSTIDKYPFQQGSSLNAAGVNYQTLKALEALKRLQELQTIASPSN